MNNKLLTKKDIATLEKTIAPITRNLKAWEGLYGMWKGKKMPDPVKWQRKIRKEWERKIV